MDLQEYISHNISTVDLLGRLCFSAPPKARCICEPLIPLHEHGGRLANQVSSDFLHHIITHHSSSNASKSANYHTDLGRGRQ